MSILLDSYNKRIIDESNAKESSNIYLIALIGLIESITHYVITEFSSSTNEPFIYNHRKWLEVLVDFIYI